jgi:hypothetical protein
MPETEKPDVHKGITISCAPFSARSIVAGPKIALSEPSARANANLLDMSVTDL